MKKSNNIIKLTESELKEIIKEAVERELLEQRAIQEGKFGNAVKSGLKTAGIAAAMLPAAAGLGMAHDYVHRNDKNEMQDEINRQVADFEKGNKYAQELDSIRNSNDISWDEANKMDESIVDRIVLETIRKYTNL